MEEPRRLTRSQTQRATLTDDENAAAHVVRKDGIQTRPRRALNNISNQQPIRGAEKAAGKENDPKKETVTGVITRARSVEIERRKSQEGFKVAEDRSNDDEAAATKEVEKASKGRTGGAAATLHAATGKDGARKHAGGFTRTLIAKSERVATLGIVQGTEKLQINGEPSAGEQQVIPASPAPDIDTKDLHNCLECAEYASDIFTFFRRLEPGIRVPPEYMNQQRYISRQMRAVLIDWLVDVHNKFRLIPESLFLAIWILDRFLSKQEVERRNLQLAGVAALVIANKYEEVYGPLLRDYEAICAGAYTRADILKMERAILKTLDFGLTVPTTFTFLARFIKASNYGKYPEFRNLAQYLCEWSLLSYTCLKWPGSQIAAAAIYASFKAFNIKEEDGDWPRVLRKHTGYSADDVAPVAAYLVNLMDKANATQYKALYVKFRKKDYCGVARYRAPMAAFAHLNPEHQQ